MAGKPGERLTDEEVREYAAYHNRQITPPAKFDTVIDESTAASGPVLRYATTEEVKAAEDATAATLAAAEEEAALDEQIRKEATKRGVEIPPVPAAPVPPAATSTAAAPAPSR